MSVENQTRIQVRDSGIELYRVILTFVICLIHAISFGDHGRGWATSALTFAVPGFVFISGWFGVRFSLSKFVRLLGLGVFCGLVALGVALCLRLPLTFRLCADVCFRMWFLCAYLVLMLLAPLIDRTLHDSRSSVSTVAGPLFILILWNWIGSTSFGASYGPMSPGIGSYTVLMMLAVYCVARWCGLAMNAGALRPVERRSRTFLALVVVLTLTVVGRRLYMGVYASPLSMIAAALGFRFFYGLRVPPLVSRFVFLVAPSTFAVILLHSNTLGAILIRRFQVYLCDLGVGSSGGVGMLALWLVTAISVFSTCLLIDLLRRVFLYPFRQRLANIINALDFYYARLVSYLLKRMSLSGEGNEKCG